MKGKRWLSSEPRSKLLIAAICLSFLVILPLFVDNRVSAKDRYYTELLGVHECVNAICAVDFDADGALGRVFIDRSSPTAPHEYWLVVREDDRELIRLPFWELDSAARTFVATTQSYASGKTHLLVYEHKGRDAPTINAVYAWNGNEMTQIHPSEAEQELFKAMATRDQNGTFTSWALYRMVRMPTLVGYYLGLILAIGMLAVKAYRSSTSSFGPSAKHVM